MNNDVSKKKKTSKEKRVLIGAICIAAAVVAGSTFAWFTSKDEVTNRLSAVGEYGVAIAEDYTPPSEWVPGQTVTKDVAVVNTGNVDALVRMWLTGSMSIISDDGGEALDTFAAKELEASSLGGCFTMKDKDSNTYYRELTGNEIKVLQTGDLVYAADGYVFTNNNSGKEETGVATTTGAIKSVDSDSFKPTGTGLYIFRRKKDDTIEYSGYYCINDGKGKDGANKYFALVDKTSTVGTDQVSEVYIDGLTDSTGDALIKKIKGYEGTPSVIKVRKATKSTVDNGGLTWTYTVPESIDDSPFKTINPYYVVALRTPAANQTSLKINIELDNIGDGSAPDTWQRITKTGSIDTFYYTDDVESSEKTTSLIKNVNLDNGLEEGAYVAFDFDLNVHLDSVQIVKDTNENEDVASISGGWAVGSGDSNVGATAAKTMGKGNDEDPVDTHEIKSISWTAAT